MTVYDRMAADFDRRRPLPAGVPEAIRSAVLAALPPGPLVLDLGCGAGRIGWPFVAAGDRYIAADLSLGMLRAFAGRDGPAPLLVQADGAQMPFADALFDAVLLVQVLSGAHGWRALLADAMRVLRPEDVLPKGTLPKGALPAGALPAGTLPAGALIVGRVAAPEDGIDARLKTQLAAILDAIDIHPYRDKPRDDALSWLARAMPGRTVTTVATWTAERSPAAFLERHGGGARFSVLDETVKAEAMRELAAWAREQFGSLTAVFAEDYRFELIIHRGQQRTTT